MSMSTTHGSLRQPPLREGDPVMTWEEVEDARRRIREGSSATVDDILDAIRQGRDERESEL